MFLLIKKQIDLLHAHNDNFNTSHVSINLKVLYISDFEIEFQYISCFY